VTLDRAHGAEINGQAIKVIMITRFCHTHEVIILVEGQSAQEAREGEVVAGHRGRVIARIAMLLYSLYASSETFCATDLTT